MPKLLWLPLAFLVAYAAVCALLFFRQQQLIYFPASTRVPPGQTDFALPRGDVVLRGWVVRPGQARAIVYFGGNGESVQHNRALFERWLPGHTVYLVAYRGYGASDGMPSHQALRGDALPLFDHVQARHQRHPVSLVGRSLGGAIASHVASQRRIGGLVLVTPFDSLAAVAQSHYPWLPVRWLLRERHEPIRDLAVYHGPLLIVRAGKDEIVPPAHTDRLIEALPQQPQVIAIPEATHNALDEVAFGAALADFFTSGAQRAP
ncbi:alpha/beta hydrolase [Luteimonas vadosa]|uniref:Alpha/beta hydrolase n=2 Tax=Luteimonas vadosa TaxID=1165507 RepID=A0ABP9E6S9_9GAMM